jgi:RNA polymerase sigma factor (sigma-70 family)
MIKTNIELKSELRYSLPDLFERFSVDIFRYALSILNDRDEAKDALQEVFVKYAENESSFKFDCSQKTWLLVLTRNYCFNRIKSGNWKTVKIDREGFEKSIENDLDLRISLNDALKSLSAEHNELLYLKEYGNYSYKEIAEITGQSVENVKIKLFRARQQLRQILKND